MPDVDAVTHLIERVAHDIVMPKFNALRDDEIHHKPTAGHVDDIVTVVDRDAEAQLTRGLLELLPSAAVLGEEAAHHQPGLLSLVHEDRPVWIIDPLDGTSNFARGHNAFGIMVGLAMSGEMRAAWINLPARGESFVAEAGAGAFCNGDRLAIPPPDARRPRGALFVRYMPPSVRDSVLSSLAGHIEPTMHTGAAAIEYTDIIRGRQEFAVYYRLLPWDHGAPALMLVESGGTVAHLDGRPYGVRSPNQLTFMTRDTQLAAQLRDWVAPGAPTAPNHVG